MTTTLIARVFHHFDGLCLSVCLSACSLYFCTTKQTCSNPVCSLNSLYSLHNMVYKLNSFLRRRCELMSPGPFKSTMMIICLLWPRNSRCKSTPKSTGTCTRRPAGSREERNRINGALSSWRKESSEVRHQQGVQKITLLATICGCRVSPRKRKQPPV